MAHLIVSNGRIITHTGEKQTFSALCINRTTGMILQLGQTEEIIHQYPDAEVIDAEGRLVLPGFICAHTHFYSLFSRGMPLKDPPPKTFIEVLQRLWWRLDKALSLEAVKCGTTTLIDHHASPNAVKGSLDEIAKVTLSAGIRACLCYEVTDRNSHEEADEGIQENIRFLQRCANHPSNLLTGLMGIHASFTINDQTLETIERRMRREVPPQLQGIHIHISESQFDQEDSNYQRKMSPIQRFQKGGLLGDRSIVVHCVAVNDKDKEILKQAQTSVIHCPSSNMNNTVGFADVKGMMKEGIIVGLGTDGMWQDMITETKQGYTGHKLESRNTQAISPELGQMLWANNSRIAEKIFGFEIGKIKEGAAGDVIILDYYPPTELTEGNILWHLVFGMTSADVNSTIVGGKILMRNHILHLPLPEFDERKVSERAQIRAKEVWAKF